MAIGTIVYLLYVWHEFVIQNRSYRQYLNRMGAMNELFSQLKRMTRGKDNGNSK